MDQKEQAARSAAIERARIYREQADAFRRLAVTESLEQRRGVLMVSARRFDELAANEEMVAWGNRRAHRYWSDTPGEGQTEPASPGGQ